MQAFELLQSAESASVLSFAAAVPALTLHPGLTELVGPAGVGKTQCCFTLAVEAYVRANRLLEAAAVPAAAVPAGHVIYVDTESTFSPPRLVEIAQSRFPQLFSSPSAVTSLLSNVLVYHAPSSAALMSTLMALEEPIITQSVALLILDSIASPVRHEFGRDAIAARQSFLSRAAGQLKELSDRFHLPCVVTNQVRARWAESKRRPQATAGTDDGARDGEDEAMREAERSDLTAALGVSWAHAVNTRWVVEDEEGGGGRRRLRVAKTPMYRGCILRYTVTNAGVVIGEQLEDSEDEQWNVMAMSIRHEHGVGDAAEADDGLSGARMEVREGMVMAVNDADGIDTFYDDNDDGAVYG